MSDGALLLDREIEDVKAQVRRELAAIDEILETLGYRSSPPGWNTPYQLHKLRRALRLHYLALRIREGAQRTCASQEITWDL